MRAVIGLILGLLGLLIGAGLVIFSVSLLNSDSFKNLQDCLDNAGTNQSQIQSCDNEFQNDVTN